MELAQAIRSPGVRSQNRICSAERRYVTASGDNVRSAGAERVDGGHGFRQTPTETARTDSGDSVLGFASLGQNCSPVPVVGDSDHSYHGEKNGGREVLRRLLPGVAMMETTQARIRNHRRLGRRLLCDRAAMRRILFQGVVNAVPMVVAHIITK